MDQYSIREGTYKGNPYIEILRNELPFFDDISFKKEFKFGLNKAKMIITCIDIIYLFSITDGQKPEAGVTYCINNGILNIDCYYKKQDEFTTSFGKRVEKPYLVLESESTSKGFGLQKAEALLLLKEGIKEFIAKHE